MFRKWYHIIILLMTASLSLVFFSWVLAIHSTPAPVPVSWVETSPTAVQHDLLSNFIQNYNPRLANSQRDKISQSILNESSRTGLDPFLVSAIIATESSFTPDVVSPCAAQGLMQISRGVSHWMQVSNPFDIRENIYAGTQYLKYLSQRFGNVQLTLAAYNAGPSCVARLGRVPNYSETQNYVKRIAHLQSSLHQKFVGVFQQLLYHSPYQSVTHWSAHPSMPNVPYLHSFLGYNPTPLVDLCENPWIVKILLQDSKSKFQLT